MLIVLTDVLACPRCGPEFGLVVRADRLEQRRVVEGGLGCPNCRELFPITGGLADLRHPPAGGGADVEPPARDPGADAEAATRYAALMGVTGGPGLVLLGGDAAPLAGRVARLVSGIGVLAIGPLAATTADREGVSRVLAAARLPLRDGAARGASVTGTAVADWLEESVRVVQPGGRIVLHPAPAEAAARMSSLGCAILLEQDGFVVASREARR